MDQSNRDKGYEFSKEENQMLLDLAKDLTRLGIAIFAAGLLLVLYLVLSFIDPVPVFQVSDSRHTVLSIIDYSVWGLISLLVIYLSVTIIKLSVPVRLIATTSGLDIPYLMNFVKNLATLSKISFVSLMVICVLMAISLVMLVLIF